MLATEFTMSRLVQSLEEASGDAGVTGGKGAALGRLARLGLPVPPGFVLTAEAFRAFVAAGELDGPLGALASGDAAEPDAEALALLRAAPWPAELRSEVEAAYAALGEATGGAPVAARSSATAEDSAGASFAGQHATLLNLSGLDAVLDGILACWASLYSAMAVHYRSRRGVVDDAPAMAVVVQALIESEASGVAFTLDPVSGDRDAVVINAAWGLGEGVVSGLVTPDHLVVRKSDGAIRQREIANKKVAIVSAPDGGTRTEELPPERAKAPAISDGEAAEIARIATALEEESGAPQDIEWALAGGKLYLLQSRPITAAGGPPPATEPAPAPAEPEEWVSEFDTDTQPDTMWTAANVQEVIPDVMSPLSCSINAWMIEQYGTEPIRRIGIRLKNDDPFFAFFYGRPFLNVSMMMEVADQSPFGSPEAVMHQFLGVQRDPDEKPTGPSLRKLLGYIRIMPRMLWQTMRMPAEIRRSEKILQTFEEEDAARPFAPQSDEELIATQDRGLLEGADVSIIHVSGGGITSSTFDLLGNLTERWLGDRHGVLLSRLCTGLAGVESAQPAHELWDLSRLVLASGELRAAFDAGGPHEIARRLDALGGADAAAFRERFDAFLSRHGHRSVMEAEPSAKSWEEDHPTVLAMVRNYLAADPNADPRRVEERQRHEREEATADALDRLSWWRRLIFRYALGQAQRWVAMREHTKSLLVRASNRGRRLTRTFARRLVDRGLLADAMDFYYLTWDEAKALARDELSRDDASIAIARRKAEEERNRAVVLPESFTGRPRPLRPEEQALPEGRVLTGIAVSPGRVTGRARVIMDPRRDATIEPGEILVAPVTDAGWTPLFIAAAGVVVDVGGTLSHGSTVAREYGLPAVVNVKYGTRMIRTGQTIMVDGSEGVVVIEP